MLVYTLPDGRELGDHQGFKLNGISYPPYWLRAASQDQLAALGITVREVQPPDPGPPPVPRVVSMFQCRATLLANGLLDTVDNLIQQSEDEAIKLAWEYATEVRRDSPLLNSIAQQIGLSAEEIDQLFIQAAQITV